MSPSVYFTTAFGSCLTIALIFFNYLRGFNTDTYQRRLFLVLLCAAFVSVVAGLAGRLFEGLPGPGPRFLLYAAAA
ncbi:MAG: GGDEF domain-containing protein, partial [Treponema sp.]|nr:GGDEF domain-containing protein [Treponema sp.]